MAATFGVDPECQISSKAAKNTDGQTDTTCPLYIHLIHYVYTAPSLEKFQVLMAVSMKMRVFAVITEAVRTFEMSV